MHTSYPEYHRQLQRRVAQLRRELPGPLGGFSDLNRATLTEGALSLKTKELMALALAIHARCEGCVAYHVHDCLRAGATRQELLETVGVAVLMGGAPCLIYGAEALEAVDQFGQLGTLTDRAETDEPGPPEPGAPNREPEER